MIALGVTFLIAIVLLGIYGLRVRAARLKQAEHGIARLEDALRDTDAAIGRVESEIATVTDAVKASLAPPERAKPAPKAEPPALLRAVLRREQAAGALRYYLAACAAGTFRFPKTELVESESLHHLLSSYARGWQEQKWIALLSKGVLPWDDVSLPYLAASATSAGEFLEAWECDMRGSALGMAKTPKGRTFVLSPHAESGY